MRVHVATAHYHANKYCEELCGDHVEIVRNDDSTIIVMSDGLGSGVKANILSTLTTKIATSLLSSGATIDDVVNTLADTLPVCKVRQLAYSTFTIVQVFHSTQEVYLAEFDNPATFIYRNGKQLLIERNECLINNRRVKESRFKCQVGDTMFVVSDGVINAGAGTILNLGWQWEHVNDYLLKLSGSESGIAQTTSMLMTVCDNLYMGKYWDDTTVVGIKIRKPLTVDLMIGPPKNPSDDQKAVRMLMKFPGKKVVCGGTTAKIVAREIRSELVVQADPETHFNEPPIGYIEGIDLVTEGALTVARTTELIRNASRANAQYEEMIALNDEGASSMLAKMLLLNSTTCNFIIGRGLNQAHCSLDAPKELALKQMVIEQLIGVLREIGKEVNVVYF